MSKLFEVDLPKLVRLLVPPRMRKMKHVAWLQALTNPVNYLYQQFRRNRDANLYRLYITPQVVYMEKLLNDRYDISGRRIRIKDALVYDAEYLYQEQELKPVYIYREEENKPVYLFTDDEIGSDSVDFFVLVPSDLTFNDNEMAALIDNYKLAGKRYKIQKV
ncbi:hypothetical protein SAMN05428949_4983 [Chitinophaga sp. YR627]|uniref:hypothetical protein n=1 Tax=Chitinophaga sp. YR627 TaxID=1881041 RepID=UPI0008E58262|nr:hypothetical protein [Chitinophaga sp. YR627]SFO33300.1 hypothetical protein SAMN05428949_4983 [Chitinophaga sp. YR627]